MSDSNNFSNAWSIPVTDRGLGLVDRRKFLLTSGIGLAGLTLFPYTSIYASPVVGAAAVLADSTGSSLIANQIAIFKRRNSISSSAKNEVERANTEMSQNGFNQFSESVVYSPQRESTYFFYPVVFRDGFNACVAFFDDGYSQGSERIGLFEGPTLFGIAELAAKLAAQQTIDLVRRVMLPRETIQAGRGSMEHSYSQKDVYRTKEGHVYVDYNTAGNGNGIVEVTALDEGGSLLAQGKYQLRQA